MSSTISSVGLTLLSTKLRDLRIPSIRTSRAINHKPGNTRIPILFLSRWTKMFLMSRQWKLATLSVSLAWVFQRQLLISSIKSSTMSWPNVCKHKRQTTTAIQQNRHHKLFLWISESVNWPFDLLDQGRACSSVAEVCSLFKRVYQSPNDNDECYEIYTLRI